VARALCREQPRRHDHDSQRLSLERQGYDDQFKTLQTRLQELRNDLQRDSITVEIMDGKLVEVPLARIADVYRPNAMSLFDKIRFYFGKLGEFLTDDLREANTEGGIFPAIFGTVSWCC
jgi:phosphate transport system permease protein